jgi:5-(carboxyamino)imidazole ribonucleotide synthase
MLARAGDPLGIRCRFLDPSPDAPAARAGELLVGAYDDPEALDRFADRLTVVTYEFRTCPSTRRASPAAGIPPEGARVRDLWPRSGFRALDVPVSPWQAVASVADLTRAVTG